MPTIQTRHDHEDVAGHDRDALHIAPDFDGFVWARTADGELCGPYDSASEARADLAESPVASSAILDAIAVMAPEVELVDFDAAADELDDLAVRDWADAVAADVSLFPWGAAD